MTSRAKQNWLFNLGLVVLFLGTAIAWRGMNAPAHAAGGSWETDGIMANTTESDADRLVIVDTSQKSIMVYKTEGAGQFKLMSARSYRYDADLEDTSKMDEVEKRNGITFVRTCEILFEKARP